MAQLTTLQINHDALPVHRKEWARDIITYLRNPLKADLPYGVTLIETHHHEDAPAYMMLTQEERMMIERALRFVTYNVNSRVFDDAKHKALLERFLADVNGHSVGEFAIEDQPD